MSPISRETVAERLCDVLAALLEHGGSLTVRELQAETGLERRTLYRYLVALGACDLVALSGGVATLGPVLSARRPARRSRR